MPDHDYSGLGAVPSDNMFSPSSNLGKIENMIPNMGPSGGLMDKSGIVVTFDPLSESMADQLPDLHVQNQKKTFSDGF